MSDLIERLDHRCRLDVTDNGIEIYLDQSDPDCQEAAARIRELEALVREYFNADGRAVAERLIERAEKAEAERDQYKEDYLRRHKDVGDQMELRIATEQRAEKAERERDAIEATTIERCAQIAQSEAQKAEDGEFYIATKIEKTIRALAKPTSAPEAATEAMS